MNPLTQFKIFKKIAILPLLIALMFVCFGLSPTAQAVCQEGCLTIANTVLGDDALFSLTTGVQNTAIGYRALFNNGTGANNTANGFRALESNTTGESNTANGAFALWDNTIGFFNTAIGDSALQRNTTGEHNTAIGVSALAINTTGSGNTATDSLALGANTGSDNTANGFQALGNNRTGDVNVAIGSEALALNTTGSNNTAAGVEALFNNSTGSGNTANGANALYSNTTGFLNAANGVQALLSNTEGLGNTANGPGALLSNTTGNFNTANGLGALNSNTTGSSNIALGFGAGSALTTGSDNIDIGNAGVVAEANTIRIGTQGTQTATFVAGISGTALGGGVAVRVNANGQLGTVGSAARFKQNIKPMDKASEAIHALGPVTFRYRDELDPEGTAQFGLIAEEVAKVNPDLVVRDEEGKPYTVRYEAVNAMLLNEFLKEHRTVQEQKAIVERLKQDFQSRLAQQQKQIEALTAGLQKVSAQVEMGRPAPRVVVKNQ